MRTLEPSIVAKRGLVFFAYFLLVEGEYFAAGQDGDAGCADGAGISRESRIAGACTRSKR